jgi:hypothetical protein
VSTYPFVQELFDGVPLIPKLEPLRFVAGDTVKWTRNIPGYPSGANTLSYVLISRTATYQVNGSEVTAEGDGFAMTIPAATTANYAAGVYRWQAYISDGSGNRYTVGEGEVEILPNLQASTAGIDDREQDEKILDAIKDMLAGKVLAGDAQRYMIHGRELQRYTFAELQKLRGQYERRVRAIRIRRGERVPSRSIGVVFRNGY